MLNTRLHAVGFVAAITSTLSLPVLPVLPTLLGRAAAGAQGVLRTPLVEEPTPVDTPSVSAVDQFLSMHQDLYDRLFGYSELELVHPRYHLEASVSIGPGAYPGTNEQGVPFVFEAQRFVDFGLEQNVEAAPGMVVTQLAIVTGVMSGLEDIEVVALTGTIVLEGGLAGSTTDHFLVPMSEIDTVPPDPGFDMPSPAPPGPGWGPAFAPNNCGCPAPGDECPPSYCAVCRDGVSLFCPLCDPVLCGQLCKIQKDYEDCILRLIQEHILVSLGCMLAIAACLVGSLTGVAIWICLAGLTLCLTGINMLDFFGQCEETHQNRINDIYTAYCAAAAEISARGDD